MSRGDAAAATWIFRGVPDRPRSIGGDGSRREGTVRPRVLGCIVRVAAAREPCAAVFWDVSSASPQRGTLSASWPAIAVDSNRPTRAVDRERFSRTRSRSTRTRLRSTRTRRRERFELATLASRVEESAFVALGPPAERPLAEIQEPLRRRARAAHGRLRGRRALPPRRRGGAEVAGASLWLQEGHRLFEKSRAREVINN